MSLLEDDNASEFLAEILRVCEKYGLELDATAEDDGIVVFRCDSAERVCSFVMDGARKIAWAKKDGRTDEVRLS